MTSISNPQTWVCTLIPTTISAWFKTIGKTILDLRQFLLIMARQSYWYFLIRCWCLLYSRQTISADACFILDKQSQLMLALFLTNNISWCLLYSRQTISADACFILDKQSQLDFNSASSMIAITICCTTQKHHSDSGLWVRVFKVMG